MKVAILHYWFTTWRGGEKVVKSLLEMYPEADVYTLFIEDEIKNKYLSNHRVFASKFNKYSWCRKHYQKLFPLYPFAVKSLKLEEKYDLIISSESGPIKGVALNQNKNHFCYIHTPMRYCWGYTNEYLKVIPLALRPVAKIFFELLRVWDKGTISAVNHYVSNSENVKKRVSKYYGREASVVYPPIELELFNKRVKTGKGEYFLSFGAITPYKRIDLLVEAFAGSQEKLIIIGKGSEKEKLENLSTDNVTFLGALPDKDLEEVIAKAKALIFPGEEDFGMIPLEVMAQGIPVLAFSKGGALETVVEAQKPSNSTGMFFNEQSISSIQSCLSKFIQVESDFDPEFIRSHARKFGEDVFQEKIKLEIQKVLTKME